jgi:hypothetical protein
LGYVYNAPCQIPVSLVNMETISNKQNQDKLPDHYREHVLRWESPYSCETMHQFSMPHGSLIVEKYRGRALFYLVVNRSMTGFSCHSSSIP